MVVDDNEKDGWRPSLCRYSSSIGSGGRYKDRYKINQLLYFETVVLLVALLLEGCVS